MLKFINKNINIKYFIFLNKYEDCIWGQKFCQILIYFQIYIL